MQGCCHSDAQRHRPASSSLRVRSGARFRCAIRHERCCSPQDCVQRPSGETLPCACSRPEPCTGVGQRSNGRRFSSRNGWARERARAEKSRNAGAVQPRTARPRSPQTKRVAGFPATLFVSIGRGGQRPARKLRPAGSLVRPRSGRSRTSGRTWTSMRRRPSNTRSRGAPRGRGRPTRLPH